MENPVRMKKAFISALILLFGFILRSQAEGVSVGTWEGVQTSTLGTTTYVLTIDADAQGKMLVDFRWHSRDSDGGTMDWSTSKGISARSFTYKGDIFIQKGTVTSVESKIGGVGNNVLRIKYDSNFSDKDFPGSYYFYFLNKDCYMITKEEANMSESDLIKSIQKSLQTKAILKFKGDF